MNCFRRVNAYVEGKGIIKTDLTFDHKIRSVGSADGKQILVPSDAIVLPGFIDEHIHGAGGADVMDGSLAALGTIARTVASEGTTGFVATTMTQSKESILKAVKAVAEFRAGGGSDGAAILGVHLEGPFIAEKYAGAQPSEYICRPDPALMREIMEASEGCIRMVTLAPEKDGSHGLTAFLKDRGITVSVGHTDAGFADIAAAVDAGATCITHVFNAQSPFRHREIGTAGCALLFDGLATELIADTVHVSVPAMKILVRNKPSDKLILITDSIRAKGTEDAVSELGGQKVIVKDGRACLQDGTLAGSILRMNRAVQNLTEQVGVPLERAADAASLNPAKNLGIANAYGSIREGKSADFAVLDPSFNVLFTVRAGKVIYRADGFGEIYG